MIQVSCHFFQSSFWSEPPGEGRWFWVFPLELTLELLNSLLSPIRNIQRLSYPVTVTHTHTHSLNTPQPERNQHTFPCMSNGPSAETWQGQAASWPNCWTFLKLVWVIVLMRFEPARHMGTAWQLMLTCHTTLPLNPLLPNISWEFAQLVLLARWVEAAVEWQHEPRLWQRDVKRHEVHMGETLLTLDYINKYLEDSSAWAEETVEV